MNKIKIIEHGTVSIQKDDILISGFCFEIPEGVDGYLDIYRTLVVDWARKRLKSARKDMRLNTILDITVKLPKEKQ